VIFSVAHARAEGNTTFLFLSDYSHTQLLGQNNATKPRSCTGANALRNVLHLICNISARPGTLHVSIQTVTYDISQDLSISVLFQWWLPLSDDFRW
jgi:hypothetical protein